MADGASSTAGGAAGGGGGSGSHPTTKVEQRLGSSDDRRTTVTVGQRLAGEDGWFQADPKVNSVVTVAAVKAWGREKDALVWTVSLSGWTASDDEESLATFMDTALRRNYCSKAATGDWSEVPAVLEHHVAAVGGSRNVVLVVFGMDREREATVMRALHAASMAGTGLHGCVVVSAKPLSAPEGSPLQNRLNKDGVVEVVEGPSESPPNAVRSATSAASAAVAASATTTTSSSSSTPDAASAIADEMAGLGGSESSPWAGSAATRLCDELAARLARDIRNPAEVGGPAWLREPLPLSNGEGAGTALVDLFMEPYLGDSLGAFVARVRRVPKVGSAAKVLVLAQASGSGKTKLAYAAALRNVMVLLIRVTDKADFSPPWTILVRHFEASAAGPLLDTLGRNLVHLLISCYAAWARRVLRRVAASLERELTASEKAKTLLLAVRNGTGDKGVEALFEAALASSYAVRDAAKICSAQVAKLAGDSGVPHMCVFLDEAQHCVGALRGVFVHKQSGLPADLFHAVVTTALSLAQRHHAVLCGTHPGMRRFVDAASGAQGGADFTDVTTIAKVGTMVQSLTKYLPLSEGDITEDIRASLSLLEGRACSFFGEGWGCIWEEISTLSSSERPDRDALVRLLTRALETAVAVRTDTASALVDAFERGARGEVGVWGAVMDAVLWTNGKMRRDRVWPEVIVRSGLAIAPPHSDILNLADEPLLHSALLDSLGSQTHAEWLQAKVQIDQGRVWEEVTALHTFKRARTGDVELSRAVGLPPSGFDVPRRLELARVRVRRIVAADDLLFDALFDAAGNPQLDVLAVHFNQFVGPDLAFFASTHIERTQIHHLVLVQNRTTKRGNVVDAVDTVTLGLLGRRPQRNASAIDGVTAQTKRARENVSSVIGRSRVARDLVENAVRVVAHPWAFSDEAVRGVNEFNRRYPDESILLAVRDPSTLSIDLFERRPGASEPSPQLTLGRVQAGAFMLRRQPLDGLLGDSSGERTNQLTEEDVEFILAPTDDDLVGRATVEELLEVCRQESVERTARGRAKEDLVESVCTWYRDNGLDRDDLRRVLARARVTVQERKAAAALTPASSSSASAQLQARSQEPGALQQAVLELAGALAAMPASSPPASRPPASTRLSDPPASLASTQPSGPPASGSPASAGGPASGTPPALASTQPSGPPASGSPAGGSASASPPAAPRPSD